MKTKIIKSLVIFLCIPFIGNVVYTQDPPPPPPPGPALKKSVGKATISYLRGSDTSSSRVGFCVLGDYGIELKEDALCLEFRFENKGKTVIKPATVAITMRSQARGRDYKYTEDHKLAISVNDKLIVSENTNLMSREVDQRGWVTEMYATNFPYDAFTKMIEAKTVTLRFGKTEASFKPEDL